MDEKSLFTKFWTDESKTTRKVLARIPEGSDYRPDPKSRTAQEIAWQIVCEEKMIIEALESGKAEWAPPPMPATMKEVLEAYEKQSAGDAPALEGTARRALGRHARVLRQPAARRRRWRGASSSTSFTIAGRSRRTCGRWDRPCRRSTGRAATNRSGQYIYNPAYALLETASRSSGGAATNGKRSRCASARLCCAQRFKIADSGIQ